MARRRTFPTGSSRRLAQARHRALGRDAVATRLQGVEVLERRQVMAVDLATAGGADELDTPVTDLAFFSAAAVAPAAPTDFRIGYSSSLERSDALCFRFGETPQPGDTWRVLENGVPIPVNTRYYKGLSVDTWETTIAAVPFDFTGRQPWEIANNPAILPTAYGERALTAGNRYEIEVLRGGQSATSTTQYGRFRGASADGVNETQTGTVALLDLDYGGDLPTGVRVVRGVQGEQVAAIVLDAGTKVTLRLGELGYRGGYTSALDLLPASLVVQTNRQNVVAAKVAPVKNSPEWTLTLDSSGLAGAPGMVSVRIINNASRSGQVVAPRYLGVIVKDSAGNVPAKPEWLAVGAVNTNTVDAQNFFRGTAPSDNTGFKAFDTQYVYLNDGPLQRPTKPVTPSSPLEFNPSAWRSSSGGFDGKKLVQSLRESAKFGAVPQIVYYNLMTPDESQTIALANLQNRPFLVEYFKDLKFTLDTIRHFANGTTVSLILEPDLLAYMMQASYDAVNNSYRDPAAIPAMTDAAYEAGLLPDPGAGNRLPNTLPGFVEAINRGVRHLSTQMVDGRAESVNLEFGWKFNLWAFQLPAGGSVAKITDVLGWGEGRKEVQKAAQATADWYVKAGILTGDANRTMDFIALDKYGTDGGATGADKYPQNGPGYTDPTKATFFWNADHWNNYLLFAKTLHETLDHRPVRLWQIPVGHVNGSEYLLPSKPGLKATQAPDLANVDKQWEDSAVSYFFGDSFSGRSKGRDAAAAHAYFAEDVAEDPLVSTDGDGTIVWGSHMAAARDAGIESIMFGPGLANSTQGGGYLGPALDGFFWAAKAQDYLKKPVPIPRLLTSPGLGTKLTAHAPAASRQADGSRPAAVVTVHRTGDLSQAVSLPVKVAGGSADAGSDYSRSRTERLRVRFEAGQSSALLVIPTLPTRKPQPQETLHLRIGGASRSQPVTRATVMLGATPRLVTSIPSSAAAIVPLVNQFRAVETFSNPTNEGQIKDQLRAGTYPDPTAGNTKGEVSATQGLAAYPGDGRNTPGAFQVDLANMGISDPNNPAIETFGEWKGTAGSAKYASAYDTQIALSKQTLSDFFGIEVSAAGLITKIPAAAAAVFLKNDALASAGSAAWDPAANPLVGQHIDAFQTEQLSLYLAGRSESDILTGVTDSRTAPKAVMDLAEGLQQQVARSFMYAVYQKFQNHPEYKDVFAEAKKYFGATLKITASTGAFGVDPGQEFWCRFNGSFIVAGSYVRGERDMFGLISALVQAAQTGTGVWNATSTDITFTRVTPADVVGQSAIFTVNKTPLNVDASYPSIFHYGAVVSPLDEGVDWNDKAAWGVKGRSIAGGLGYTRLGTAQAVTGTTAASQPGIYRYSGLGTGGTLTLSGAGPFVVVSSVPSPVEITNGGYGVKANQGQTYTAGRTIDISSFGMTTPQQVLDASFYGWYDSSGTLAIAKVTDASVPTTVPAYLYFVPAAQGDAANVIANQNGFYDQSSPYYRSARVAVANAGVLGRPSTAEEWATHFRITPAAPGTGVIDASGVTGNVLVIADDTIATVKLGSGGSIAFAADWSRSAKTYVLNAQPAVGSGARPILAINAGDTIDARLVSGQPTWTIDNREQATADNNAPVSPFYRRYAAFSRYFATQGSATSVAEFAGSLRTTSPVADPASVIRAALRS